MVPVREAFSQPYISFFHVQVNEFSVTSNNYYHNHQLLQTGFLRVYRNERYITLPLDTFLPEICAFIIGFSCTMWTKLRFLASSLADGVLADDILIPPCPPILPTYIRMVRGPRNKYRK